MKAIEPVRILFNQHSKPIGHEKHLLHKVYESKYFILAKDGNNRDLWVFRYNPHNSYLGASTDFYREDELKALKQLIKKGII
jgi:hypothetical protein